MVTESFNGTPRPGVEHHGRLLLATVGEQQLSDSSLLVSPKKSEATVVDKVPRMTKPPNCQSDPTVLFRPFSISVSEILFSEYCLKTQGLNTVEI